MSRTKNRRTKNETRAGMTILEVLFAIMITSVGLLGAISVFPVASEYARKGRLNDEVAVCGESAAHKLDAMGMRRPDHWITWRYVNGGLGGNAYFVPGTLGPQVISNPPPVIVRAGVNAGESYCLDPRFMAQNIIANGSPPPAVIPSYPLATLFPAFPFRPNANAGGTVSGPNDPDSPGNPGAPRMQRITLVNGGPGGAPPYAPAFIPMGRFQADLVFSFEDQLAYERPGVQKGEIARSDNSSPAFQLLSPIKDANNPPTIYPGKREDEGKLSWMATLVPKLDRWNATLEDKYVLSIVVFYNRSPSLAIPDYINQSPQSLNVQNEYTASILGRNNNNVSDFHSSGFGGGEVTISIPAADPFASEKLKVRSGDWVMLSGHSRYSGGPTVPTFKWYRISDADEDPYSNTVQGVNYLQRDVTLVGPDWDLQDVLPFDTNTGAPNPDGYPDDVEVTIVPHVVAVFDRTVRLERDGTGY